MVSLRDRCLAEAAGTFILVFLGTGAVHVAVLTESLTGLWQVAVVWGLGVTLAIYVVGGISGAHINPAMTVALAAWGRFDGSRVAAYVGSQVAGAFAASAVLFVLFNPYLAEKEKEKQVVRGQPGSEITAMCYGEYYPNPGGLAAKASPEMGQTLVARLAQERDLVPAWRAFLTEVVATMLLALVVFAVTDPRNGAAPAAGMAPAFIGLTVAALICVVAPLTQACLNPARDFGPRLFAYLAGWGEVALAGYGSVVVYILAPVLGALAGGALYTKVIGPVLAAGEENIKENAS